MKSFKFSILGTNPCYKQNKTKQIHYTFLGLKLSIRMDWKMYLLPGHREWIYREKNVSRQLIKYQLFTLHDCLAGGQAKGSRMKSQASPG